MPIFTIILFVLIIAVIGYACQHYGTFISD